MALILKNGKPQFDDALLHYIRNGNIEVFKSLLQNDNPNATDFSGQTLLHSAAESNNVSMTRFLLDNKYTVDIKDNYGDTPLMLAVGAGSVDTAKLLINAGANIYLRDARGKSILPDRKDFAMKVLYGLSRSCESEWLKKYRELVKIILEKVRKDCWNDEKLLISRLNDIDCSLVKAIYLRDANVTRLMLENGFAVNEYERDTKETALHKAVKWADFENVKLLLEFGADVGDENQDGLTPIYFTFGRDEKVNILKILIEHGALLRQSSKGSKPSECIIANGRLWAIKTIIQYDFGWNPQSSIFPLVCNRDPDALEVLRGMNLDFNTINNPSKKPVLSSATAFGKLTKIKFLLEAGANPNVVGADGHTPFTSAFLYPFAVRTGILPSIRLLLQHGANAQFCHQDGRTVFDIIAVFGDYEDHLKPVIAHLAMIESRGEIITDVIRGKINGQDSYKNYFETCKEQLGIMKDSILYDNLTLYKLLTERHSKITRYARNYQFVEKFKKHMKVGRSLDPYYSISLWKRVGKTIDIVRLRKEAVTVLGKIITHRCKSYQEILCEIVEYFNVNDLKNICKVSDLEETESFNLETLFA